MGFRVRDFGSMGLGRPPQGCCSKRLAGLGVRIQSLGFRVWGSEVRVHSLGFTVEGLGFMAKGFSWHRVFGLRVSGLGIGIQVFGLRFRVRKVVGCLTAAKMLMLELGQKFVYRN